MPKLLFLISTLFTLSFSSAGTTVPTSASSSSTNATNFQADFRIINGVQASLSLFPFAVFIYTDLGDSGSACGGTLIAPNVVVTAAHCLYDNKTLTPASSLTVSANSIFNIQNNPNIYLVSKAIPHPNYKADTAANDIGILILSKNTNVPSSSFAKIYDLPVSNDLTTAAAGWGITSNSANATVSKVLMTVPLVISSSSNCKSLNPSYTNNDGMAVCTMNQNSQDTCYGDSGGPLVYTGVSPYPLLGLTSFGNAPTAASTPSDEKPPCAATGGYGFYTHVYYFIDWIASTASLEKSSITYSSGNSTSPSDQKKSSNTSSSNINPAVPPLISVFSTLLAVLSLL
ncbi:Glandular kallikrein, prostatic [Smittium culicis]|uniref:Glandular kallikrein, prostatic n=1 Tax=Smittium culicis TaxID=133412 RepID=A0A1R1WYI5_9FUNG|nr:Glandular kallikrein, prostatic [Smittium culicis]OMJ08300.1 Glandular kallikrein, prostatic [Smittium culicis]